MTLVAGVVVVAFGLFLIAPTGVAFAKPALARQFLLAFRRRADYSQRCTRISANRTKPATVDDYIAGFDPEIQAVLQTVRGVVRRAAPNAREVISYSMPALKQNGILVFFAAFKNHIGLYPPIKGDAVLQKAAARYAGEKGNLRFPLDEPMPLELIGALTKLRARQDAAKAKAASRRPTRRAAPQPSRARR